MIKPKIFAVIFTVVVVGLGITAWVSVTPTPTPPASTTHLFISQTMGPQSVCDAFLLLFQNSEYPVREVMGKSAILVPRNMLPFTIPAGAVVFAQMMTCKSSYYGAAWFYGCSDGSSDGSNEGGGWLIIDDFQDDCSTILMNVLYTYVVNRNIAPASKTTGIYISPLKGDSNVTDSFLQMCYNSTYTRKTFPSVSTTNPQGSLVPVTLLPFTMPAGAVVFAVHLIHGWFYGLKNDTTNWWIFQAYTYYYDDIQANVMLNIALNK